MLSFHCRLKHEASVELLRAKELLNIQSSTIGELEKKLAGANRGPAPDARTDLVGTAGLGSLILAGHHGTLGTRRFLMFN